MPLSPLFDGLTFEGFFCVCCGKKEVSNFSRHYLCRQGEQPDIAEFFMGNFSFSNKHSLNLPLFYSFCNLIPFVADLRLGESAQDQSFMVLWAQLKVLYSLLKHKMRELTNILTPGFTRIKSENQICGLIAHVAYQTLGLRRWRLTEKAVRNKELYILL